MPRVLENGDRRILESADLNVRITETETPNVQLNTFTKIPQSVNRASTY